MPESRGRIRKGRAQRSELAPAKGTKPNPDWYAPVMVGLMVLGLIWIVMVYLSSGVCPWPRGATGTWRRASGSSSSAS